MTLPRSIHVQLCIPNVISQHRRPARMQCFSFRGEDPTRLGKLEGRLCRRLIYKSAGSEGLFARGAQGHEVPHQYADLRLREANRRKGGHGGEDGWMNRRQTLRIRDSKRFLYLSVCCIHFLPRRGGGVGKPRLRRREATAGGLRRELASVLSSSSLSPLPFFPLLFYDRPHGFTVHSVISCVLITR